MFARGGEDRLKVGRGVFFIDDGGFDLGEACFLEHCEEVGFGKAEPAVVVEFTRFFKVMLEEVEDDEGTACFEEFVRGAEGALGAFGVVEGLGEDREIDGAGLDRGGFEVAESIFEIG